MGAQGEPKKPQKSAQISKSPPTVIPGRLLLPNSKQSWKNVLFWDTLEPRKWGSRLHGSTVFTVGTGSQKGTKNISKMPPFGHPWVPLGVRVPLLGSFGGVLIFYVFWQGSKCFSLHGTPQFGTWVTPSVLVPFFESFSKGHPPRPKVTKIMKKKVSFFNEKNRINT